VAPRSAGFFVFDRVVRDGFSEIFNERVGNFRAVVVGDSGGGAFYVFHQAVEIIARVGDADYADGGAVPELGGI
jgi:hypothetical protein